MTLLRWTTVLIVIICLLLEVTKKRKTGYIQENEDSYIYSGFLTVLFASVLIIAEGFRNGYMDTGNYKGLYRFLSDDLGTLINSSKWPGFDFLQWILRRISTNPQFFIFFLALVITIIDITFFRRYSTDFAASLFLYFLFSFLGNCNGLRQVLAAVLLMLAFPWLVEGKYLRYILWIILLSTIHSSILYIIPLVFLVGGKRWNKGLVLFLGFCVFSTLVPGPINALIGRFVVDDYSHYLNVYTRGANYLNVLIDAVPLTLGYIYHKRNINNIGENRVVDTLINMHIIRFCFILLATRMAAYARIGMYMRNSTAIIIPFLISQVFSDNKKVIKTIALVLYFIVFAIENSMLNAIGAFEQFYLNFSLF